MFFSTVTFCSSWKHGWYIIYGYAYDRSPWLALMVHYSHQTEATYSFCVRASLFLTFYKKLLEKIALILKICYHMKIQDIEIKWNLCCSFHGRWEVRAYTDWVTFSCKMFIPRFMKICQLVQKLPVVSWHMDMTINRLNRWQMMYHCILSRTNVLLCSFVFGMFCRACKIHHKLSAFHIHAWK